MELVFVWMPLVLAGVVAAVIAVLVVLRRRSGRDDGDIVSAAHTERMLRMPEYKSAYRRALAKLGAMFVLVLVSLGAFSVVAARPITTDVADTDRVNRDIVLCLDVSGSMTAADAQIVERFLELVEQFHGERIALVVWDSSAAQVFPLNDDYDYVEEQLASIADETSTDIGDVGDVFGGDPDGSPPLWAGTDLGNGSSLIGDGLASCVLRFDHPELDRSRTIILATDNQLAGIPIVTLEEAASFSIERDVRVYGIEPGGAFGSGAEIDDLRTQLQRTGGEVFSMGDASGGQSIVDEVLDDQATTLQGVPELVVTDHPGLAVPHRGDRAVARGVPGVEVEAMTFEPLFELWTTVVLLAPPAALLVWQLFRTWRPAKGVPPGTWRARVDPARRLLIVALLAFAAAGPALPGGMTKVVVSDIDVFLVIDTTTSSNAEDYDDGSTRLDQIKLDAFQVATPVRRSPLLGDHVRQRIARAAAPGRGPDRAADHARHARGRALRLRRRLQHQRAARDPRQAAQGIAGRSSRATAPGVLLRRRRADP